MRAWDKYIIWNLALKLSYFTDVKSIFRCMGFKHGGNESSLRNMP